MKLTFSRITMFTAALLALAASTASSAIKTERLMFRTTVAASATAAKAWNAPSGSAAFADSSVCRKVAASALQVDTTMAYPIGRFTRSFPIDGALAVQDSTGYAWLVLDFWAQQTGGEYSWTGTSASDSLYFAAQISFDGNAWIDVDGTPTRAFFASAGPINSNVNLLAIEQDTGSSNTRIVLRCEPSLATGPGDQLIINRNICACGGMVRFIVGGGIATGQFALNATYDDGN